MALFSDVLLTVDFDRTLTAPDSTIPERKIRAIEYFMENGGIFTMNTGRSIPMSEKNIFGKVPTNAPLLLYNGSGAYDEKARRFTDYSPIDLNPGEVLRHLQEKFPDLGVEVQGRDAHYLMHKDAGWEDYCDHNDCRWAYCDPDAIPGPFLKFAFYGQFRENTVASMYGGSPEELARMEEVIAYVEKMYGDKVDVFRPCARIVDVHAKGVSKIRAARDLQERLGRKILVCVGDAENDLTMLRGADYAFCPSDGSVAHLFDNVCPCGEGAVAEVILERIPALLKNKT